MALTHGAAWGALVLRVVLGVVLVMHGYAAFWLIGPRGIGGYVIRMGFPAVTALPLAWYLIVVHALGGALIVIGLWTRLAAVLNIPIMLCAVLLVHLSQGFFMKGVIVDAAAGRAATAGYELSLLVLGCTVAVALIGAGPYSIDRGRSAPGRRR
jgi:putative oxidoreductase